MQIGQTVGSYNILEKLGEGGMGEVYRARDPRLNRDVAIKVVQASVAADPERLRRFTVEAQAVAALNHPNVLTIYEVGTHEGHPFLATELLEGETLRTKLTAGPLPFSKAIDSARQVADGLAAAHAKGLAHRDIKPENLFITTDGRVKILDFGLAKMVAPVAAAGMTAAETRLDMATSAGVVLGTAGYMSPEQVRGQTVDHRSDLFSLGIVIYEMVSGRRPFAGDSAVETMNAILTADPQDLTSLTRVLPPGVTHVVHHCLEKNPEERYQSARDLSFALRTIQSSSGTDVSAGRLAIGGPARSSRRWLPVAAAGVAGVLLGALAILPLMRSRDSLDLSRYRFTPLAADAEPEVGVVWSPDGKSVAYTKKVAGVAQVFVRALDADVATQVTSVPRGASSLFWFPDNTRIGFVDEGDGVWSVSRVGGDPERLQSGDMAAAALSPSGSTLAFWMVTRQRSRQTSALYFASPSNGAATKYGRALVDLDAYSPNYLQFSPDGTRLLYAGYTPDASLWMIALGASGPGPPTRLFARESWGGPPEFSWMPDSRHVVLAPSVATGSTGLWIGDVTSGALTRMTAGVEQLGGPSVSPDGTRIALVAGGTDFDLVEIPLHAEPVLDRIATSSPKYSGVWTRSGDMLYVSDRRGTSEIWLRRADGSDRLVVSAGSFPPGPVPVMSAPTLSPEGRRVAFLRWNGKTSEGWVAPLEGGTPVRLGAEGEDGWMVSWSPDGKQVAVVATSNRQGRLLTRRVGSSEPPQVIAEDANAGAFMIEWSPAGDWIAYATPDGPTLVSPNGKARRALTKDRALAVAWSRDGRTLYGLMRTPEGVTVSAIDIGTGQIRVLRRLDPSMNPQTPTNPSQRLSLDPTGTKLLTTVMRERKDLWILER
jgi:serine/threonine protein kinase/Tol biopolymer transport system component